MHYLDVCAFIRVVKVALNLSVDGLNVDLGSLLFLCGLPLEVSL